MIKYNEYYETCKISSVITSNTICIYIGDQHHITSFDEAKKYLLYVLYEQHACIV